MHMTRRLLLLAPVVPLLVATHAGAAPRARTLHGAYKTPGGVAPVIHGGMTIQGERYGDVAFGTLARERSIAISIADDSGLPVLAEVSLDADGDGQAETLTQVCGATKDPIPLPKGKQVAVSVSLVVGVCGSGVSVPTTGVVTATIR